MGSAERRDHNCSAGENRLMLMFGLVAVPSSAYSSHNLCVLAIGED